ncbi:hypothetical protein STENM327S_00749 [Streptomyces tendae]
MKRSCAAISSHLSAPARAALSFSGTVSLLRSSGVSAPAFFSSAVPVGKLDLTTGPSRLVGPLRRERTTWVIGSTRRRT